MIGNILFYVLWPLVWLYAPITRRVRAVIVHDDKILVIKNWFGPGYWQLPGGGIHMGEGVVSAIRREITEELGIEVISAKELLDRPVICKQFGLLMRYHFVLVELDSYEVSDYKLSRSLSSVEWQKTDSLSKVSTEVLSGLNILSKQR